MERGKSVGKRLRYALCLVAASAAACLLGFSEVQGGLRQCGDVDCNGEVTAVDALRVLQDAVGQPAGLQCPEICPAQGTCGDGDLAPIDVSPFPASFEFGECHVSVELAGGPAIDEIPPGDFQVSVLKAVDAAGQLVPPSTVEVAVVSTGCDCDVGLCASNPLGVARNPTRAPQEVCDESGSPRTLGTGHPTEPLTSMTATALPGTTSTTIWSDYFECCCTAAVSVVSAQDLTVLEVAFDAISSPSSCRANDIPGANVETNDGLVFRIDAGVAEECDDGNTESGDGCSSECRIEPEP